MYTSIDINKRTLIRGGSETQFPGKLHDMMTYVEREGLDDVISWICNGRAFKVHKPEKLLEILPIFFGQTKYRSFQRQLNMWHFERILKGPDKGAFMHPYFVRGNKSLCAYMSRHLFDTPTLPDALITPFEIQQPNFTNVSKSSGIMSTDWSEVLKQMENQIVKADTGFQISEENPFVPVSLSEMSKELLEYENRKADSMRAFKSRIQRVEDQDLIGKKSMHGPMSRELDSIPLSQLLEPIAPEVFETIF